MRDKKWILAVIGVLVAVAIGWTLRPSPGVQADRSSPGLDVPFEFMDGSHANLADYAGRPLVVNFWASWCPACVAEMPDFQEVHAALGDEVVFLGLNMQENDPAAARALVEGAGTTYQLGLDPSGSIFTMFGGIAMPTTVFIDADGRVVRTHSGTLFADDLEELIRTELLSS